jgi:hypothetical protein
MSRSSSLINRTHSRVGQSRRARSPAHLSLTAVSCPDRQLIGNGRHASKSLRSQLLIGLIGVALQWRSCLELQDCLPLKRPMIARRWAPALPSRVFKPGGRGPCHWDLEKSSRPPNGLGSEPLPEPRFPSAISDIISLTSTHCTSAGKWESVQAKCRANRKIEIFPDDTSQPAIDYHRAEHLSLCRMVSAHGPAIGRGPLSLRTAAAQTSLTLPATPEADRVCQAGRQRLIKGPSNRRHWAQLSSLNRTR